MYTSQNDNDNPMSPLTVNPKASKKKANRNTVSLANSTYVRNADAFSVIQKDIASGASMLGASQRDKSKIQSLAKLIGNKNAFE
mmetsp:Transcript_26005/g.32434  ORF Transcript_26005/g.32434 Transcript_26005/m.32434 type:complete len:84 (+) Transcript_26005:344-595(+)